MSLRESCRTGTYAIIVKGALKEFPGLFCLRGRFFRFFPSSQKHGGPVVNEKLTKYDEIFWIASVLLVVLLRYKCVTKHIWRSSFESAPRARSSGVGSSQRTRRKEPNQSFLVVQRICVRPRPRILVVVFVIRSQSYGSLLTTNYASATLPVSIS